MISLVVERMINAPRENVWAVAGDFTRTLDTKKPFTTETEGDKDNNNVGCVRRVRSGAVTVRERLEAADPPGSLSYVILSGVPVKDFRGKMEFTAEDGRTLVRWSAGFTPRIPGTGRLIKSMMRKSYNDMLDGIEKAL
jgi:ligand-binding SRPBCC domain-containing protein